MSATVGAALKKIAVALFCDKKTIKKVAIFFLSILVGLLMPMAAVIGIFAGGNIEINEEDIDNALTDEQKEYYAKLNATYGEINERMQEAGFPDRVDEAQTLFVMGLVDHMYDENFVIKLVGCFSPGQTDADLVAMVNSVFGTQISLDDYLKVIVELRKATINPHIFTDPLSLNNVDLVAFCQEACDDQWGYVWATYGKMLSAVKLDELAEQFPDEVGQEKTFIKQNWCGHRTADCAGLIKAYFWYDHSTGEIVYELAGYEDKRANELYEEATEKGTLDTIPETPGLGVWHDGHVGVYIGNGYVIHANGTHRGVEKQLLSETKFTHWFEIPGLIYLDEDVQVEPTELSETANETTQMTTIPSETSAPTEVVSSES